MAEIGIIAAVLAGVITFFSPCVLPLIPAYLGYLAGTTLDQTKGSAGRAAKWKIFINSLLFVLGFSAVFSLLGVLVSTALLSATVQIQLWLARFGGALIIFFGLYLMGVIRIPWLEREHSFNFYGLKPSYVTSFIFGASFAVGWTPCVGPVLGSIFGLALVQPTNALGLLFAYSVGLGVPFLVVGAFTAHASGWIKSAGPWLQRFKVVVGIILVLFGILVFLNRLSLIADFGILRQLVG